MLWIMLHSGSRNIGNRIGMHFIALAKQEMEKQLIHLPDKDLAYLTEHTALFDDYVEAVGWAQDYARANRDAMLEVIVRMLKEFFPDLELTAEAVNCHHNYVEKETHFGTNVWVTRKGAVRARKDDLGIIPGSMGARSFIVRGKGNAESFCSCSHGAGRAMSRAEAKRRFTLEDHRLSTEGVECRKDDGVIDETPKAYKDIEAVMAAQADLIEVVHILKQVLCVKG
jgi:tRNA-splicing ligase RtcB (3'-phosphate/5'-hydroxy nucleic acid ligase)